MSNTLFDEPANEPNKPLLTCRSCEHRERWQCGGSIIQYCAVIKSKRTDNGKLKIKATDAACPLYLKQSDDINPKTSN